MNVELQFLIPFICGVIVAILCHIISSHFNKKPYQSFEECITVLTLVINTELESFDTDVFTKDIIITNSTYDNYYNDITHRIIRNLSNELIENLSRFISKDAIYRIIAKSVKKYLVGKINKT